MEAGSWERKTAFSLAFARESFKEVNFEILGHLDVLVYQFKKVDYCLGGFISLDSKASQNYMLVEIISSLK